jgi:signal transduction histidine kinase
MKDYKKVLYYARKMPPVIKTILSPQQVDTMFLMISNLAMAESYYNLSMLDSSLVYATKTYHSDSSWPYRINSAYANNMLGDIYTKKAEDIKALSHYRASLAYSLPASSFHIASASYKGISMLFKKNGNIDSALFYAKLAMRTLQENLVDVKSWGENISSYMVEITPLIAALYKANNQTDSAYKYLQLSVDLRDTLYNTERIRQFQTLSFNESAKEQQQLQKEQEMRQLFKTRIKIYGLIAGLLIVLSIAVILFRNNNQKQKINLSLKQQKIKVENTLEELKRTQAQLIQSEKMASLGELTAGIAHEIQNPLNFVNNFSEVNTELVEELDEEIDKGNWDGVKTIAKAIKENEGKINHHGKRADAIVKGMLHHSRSSDGQKELTDITALTDEYLRLAYHGLRAKDKSFNALIETDFDQRVGKINIVPQDIGRAILNLITNAFYTVNEKKKSPHPLKGGMEYEPIVTVSTKRLGPPLGDGGKIEISIKDNGNGIPEKVKEKIFQPFFTTKPTGQGTGLGLSLSYDIVKAHGGELKVETEEGKRSEFIIQLPA